MFCNPPAGTSEIWTNCFTGGGEPVIVVSIINLDLRNYIFHMH